jgi:hypothetical protein
VKIERRERTIRAQAMQLETTMMLVLLTLSSFRGSARRAFPFSHFAGLDPGGLRRRAALLWRSSTSDSKNAMT